MNRPLAYSALPAARHWPGFTRVQKKVDSDPRNYVTTSIETLSVVVEWGMPFPPEKIRRAKRAMEIVPPVIVFAYQSRRTKDEKRV